MTIFKNLIIFSEVLHVDRKYVFMLVAFEEQQECNDYAFKFDNYTFNVQRLLYLRIITLTLHLYSNYIRVDLNALKINSITTHE